MIRLSRRPLHLTSARPLTVNFQSWLVAGVEPSDKKSLGLKKLGLFELNSGFVYGSHDTISASTSCKVRFAKMAVSVFFSLSYWS